MFRKAVLTAETEAKGGDVIFMADNSLRTLMDFRYKRKYEAENGQDGMKKKKFGKDGKNLIIKVPPGTVVIDEESGLVMKDLVEDGDSFVAAKGGKGGKGNTHYKNSVRQAPNFAEAGGFRKRAYRHPGNETDCRRRTRRISQCWKIHSAFGSNQREAQNRRLSFHDH